MSEKFDVIVVGGGPSGNAAAYTLAKAGLKVLQLERGEYPGSKNVQGAILYSDALERIIPDFREDAPLERHLIEQRVWVLDDESYVGSNYRSAEFNKPPFNCQRVARRQPDKVSDQPRRIARRNPVLERAPNDGANGRLLDVIRRVEVRFAGPEADYVDPFGAKLFDLRADCKRFTRRHVPHP